jgi:DnaJ-class molecular chaperone
MFFSGRDGHGEARRTAADVPRCDGDGEITINIDNREQTVTCPVCQGSGNA